MTKGPAMELRQFVLAVCDKVEIAAAAGDRTEAARLLRVLRDAAEEQAEKLERDKAP